MRFDTLNDYSALSGVGIVVLNEDCEEVFSTPAYDKIREALSYIEGLFADGDQSGVAMIHGCYQSMRFGGRYIFVCPSGFVYFVSPIIREEKRNLFLIGGPVIMTNHDDYIEFDISTRIKDFNYDETKKMVLQIPVFDSGKISVLSEQLFVNASHLSDRAYYAFDLTPVTERPHEQLEMYTEAIYSPAERGIFSEEQKLIEALAMHDEFPSRALLNSILGQILFHTGKNLELVKGRILELIIILSRAAVRDGMDPEIIKEMKYRVFDELDHLDDLNEIIVWLNLVLEKFTNPVFNNPNAKHADIIRDTVSFIRKHYAGRITLEDAAKNVYISPQYLSKLFKEETGQSFKSYLNKTRIEQSKLMMKNLSVSLTEISSRVGYEDQSYFTKVFKRYEGLSPNQYRATI